MKRITIRTIYILIVLFFFTQCEKSIYLGDIQFSTQNEIQDFEKSGYSRVTGSVRVHGDDIINLNGLSRLNAIEGDLVIEYNKSLIDIDEGLSNLSYVGRDISIWENSELSKIDGLNKVISTKNLTITQNFKLVEINGFSNLESIDGNLNLFFNIKLNLINGFHNLSEIKGSLDIDQSYALTNVNSFSNLTYIGENLHLERNSALIDINGFSKLNFVGTGIRIESNRALKDLCVLQPLLKNGSFGGSLYIVSNYYNPTLNQIVTGNCSN
jgi:hypothetical protein